MKSSTNFPVIMMCFSGERKVSFLYLLNELSMIMTLGFYVKRQETLVTRTI